MICEECKIERCEKCGRPINQLIKPWYNPPYYVGDFPLTSGTTQGLGEADNNKHYCENKI